MASYKPGPEAIVAEAVEALGEHCVLPLDLARGTRERLLVLADLLLQDLVHVGRHLDLTQTLNLQREGGREGGINENINMSVRHESRSSYLMAIGRSRSIQGGPKEFYQQTNQMGVYLS